MPSRVLVVDDDSHACELIQEVLRSVEVESLAFTESKQALPYLAKEKFDAVFVDVRMPPPDGIELTQKIRATGLNRGTPIIVITGEDEHALLSRVFGTGANFFLYKPIDRQDILRLVRVTQDSIENEKRRFRRIKVSCKVSMECGTTRATGSTLDLSIGGMFVQSPQLFPVGSSVQVGLDLKSDPPVSLTVRVLRIVGDDCMGMQFENLRIEQSKRLQDFLLPLIGPKPA